MDIQDYLLAFKQDRHEANKRLNEHIEQMLALQWLATVLDFHQTLMDRLHPSLAGQLLTICIECEVVGSYHQREHHINLLPSQDSTWKTSEAQKSLEETRMELRSFFSQEDFNILAQASPVVITLDEEGKNKLLEAFLHPELFRQYLHGCLSLELQEKTNTPRKAKI